MTDPHLLQSRPRFMVLAAMALLPLVAALSQPLMAADQTTTSATGGVPIAVPAPAPASSPAAVPPPAAPLAAIHLPSLSLSPGGSGTADAAGSQAIATVDGEPIPLGVLEDRLLQREGAGIVQAQVHRHLAAMDWAHLADTDLVVRMATWQLHRGILATELMSREAGSVREQMLDLRLVQNAMTKAGIVVDQPMIAGELALMRRNFLRSPAGSGPHAVGLADFIQRTQQMNLVEFSQQPGFAMIAGLHALVRARARSQVTEAALKAYAQAHRSDYHIPEGVLLSAISVGFRSSPDGSIPPGERTRLEGFMKSLHDDIAQGRLSFTGAFHDFADGFDLKTGADANLGWVDRSGHRQGPLGPIPLAIVNAAFAAPGPFPQLLPPIVRARGIDLIRVDGRRAEQDPPWSAIRDDVFQDDLADHMDAWTKDYMDEARRQAHIQYESLPELIEARERFLTLPDDINALPPLKPGDKALPPDPASPVALVDGVPITLRQLEDEILRREGADQVEEIVHHQLAGLHWNLMADQAPIVSIGSWTLTRGQLATELLAGDAGTQREQLINDLVVHRAIDHAGITIDRSMCDRELAALKDRLRTSLDRQGQPQVDFTTFIKETQHMSVADYEASESFHMMVGLHELVRQQEAASLGEAQLNAFFQAHRQRYRIRAGVDLSDIFIPYKANPGGGAISPAERTRLGQVMAMLYENIATHRVSFASTFHNFASSYDPDAAADGRLGWVAHDGTRGILGARRIDAAVVAKAFGVVGPYPVLLPPIAHATGIDIIEVNGYRAPEEPTFAMIRSRLIDDLIADQLIPRTQTLLGQLRVHDHVTEVDLPALVRARWHEVGLPGPVRTPTSDRSDVGAILRPGEGTPGPGPRPAPPGP